MLPVEFIDLMFQSTPDLVNRENFWLTWQHFKTLLFQSTPDLVNRENAVLSVGFDGGGQFQSTPDLVNRENIRYPQAVQWCAPVSIHSRFS